MGDSKIEWTDVTWNPITGCSKISEGCQNCYAERFSKRISGRFGYDKDEPFKITLHKDKIQAPFKIKKPKKIFVCSMGDLFHKGVSFEWIAAVFGVMSALPKHTFQVLTKRPERALKWFEWIKNQKFSFHKDGEFRGVRFVARTLYGVDNVCQSYLCKNPKWPLPNVWFGVTAENQKRADERISLLLKKIPASVRFVSFEPLLGPIDISKWIRPRWGEIDDRGLRPLESECIDWAIVGAEQGYPRRPMNPEWARSIRNQCKEGGFIPFFFKKMTGNSKIPEDLMIRDFPYL